METKEQEFIRKKLKPLIEKSDADIYIANIKNMNDKEINEELKSCHKLLKKDGILIIYYPVDKSIRKLKNYKLYHAIEFKYKSLIKIGNSYFEFLLKV